MLVVRIGRLAHRDVDDRYQARLAHKAVGENAQRDRGDGCQSGWV
jgi:hypothetical protein